MKKRLIAATVAVSAVVALAPAAYAATTYNSTLTQQITAGTISTSIRDAAGALVPAPTFAMSAVTVSNSVQTSTGTFGSNNQRITVDNPNGSVTGGAWTLTLNATVPGSSNWSDGTNTYAYNGTAATGQLTVNPAAGAVTAVTGGSTGVTLGTSSAFTGTTPVTLATASSSAASIWNGYLTGVDLSQSIPASQPAGAYTLPMTQTVTAQ